jgi:hypothetical protein
MCISHGGVLAEPSPYEHKNAMENNDTKQDLVTKGVMGLLLGLSLMLAGIWVGRQLHIVWNIWPSTDGVVVRGTSQEVIDIPYTEGGGAYYSYVPRIEFSYTVGGKRYTTEAPSVYSANTFDQAAANLSRMYAPGTHHPIRYNPRNPRDIQFGIIEFGPLAFAFLLVTVGGVLSAIGLHSLALAYAQGAEQAPAGEQPIPGTLLPFPSRSRTEPLAATLICPSCGRRVAASEETCPNCLKSMRAA